MKKKVKTPGDMLLEQLEDHGKTVNAASKDIGVSQTALRLVTRNEARITTALAFKLAAYFGVSVRDWLTAQMEYDLSLYKL